MGGSMMKKESLILLLSVYTCLLFAVPADMTPQYVVMANGDSILVYHELCADDGRSAAHQKK